MIPAMSAKMEWLMAILYVFCFKQRSLVYRLHNFDAFNTHTHTIERVIPFLCVYEQWILATDKMYLSRKKLVFSKF